jgi:hypothetical protein
VAISALEFEESRIKVRVLLQMGYVRSKVVRQRTVLTDFSIQTPTATAGVRGTTFTVKYDPQHESTRVMVEEGSVSIEPKNSSLATFALSSGQEVDISAQQISAVRAITSTTVPARPAGGSPVDAARKCFVADPGAGLTDRNAHYVWIRGQSSTTVESNLKTKAAYLFRCPSLTQDRLSSAFADISIVVAKYVPRAACFGGDAGAVSSDWSGHKTWSQSKGAEEMLGNLQQKISSALRCMDRPRQNSFFADLSVAIAEAGSRHQR